MGAARREAKAETRNAANILEDNVRMAARWGQRCPTWWAGENILIED
jgi:hypothetical protein